MAKFLSIKSFIKIFKLHCIFIHFLVFNHCSSNDVDTFLGTHHTSRHAHVLALTETSYTPYPTVKKRFYLATREGDKVLVGLLCPDESPMESKRSELEERTEVSEFPKSCQIILKILPTSSREFYRYINHYHNKKLKPLFHQDTLVQQELTVQQHWIAARILYLGVTVFALGQMGFKFGPQWKKLINVQDPNNHELIRDFLINGASNLIYGISGVYFIVLDFLNYAEKYNTKVFFTALSDALNKVESSENSKVLSNGHDAHQHDTHTSFQRLNVEFVKAFNQEVHASFNPCFDTFPKVVGEFNNQMNIEKTSLFEEIFGHE